MHVGWGAADAQIVNSIIWGNTAADGPQLACADQSTPSTMAVNYCNVQGGQSNVFVDTGCMLNWGSGNINSDPLFVDAVHDDYSLSSNSPCIDAGDNAAVISLTDLIGGLRIQDGDADQTPVVDLGAYERSP